VAQKEIILAFFFRIKSGGKTEKPKGWEKSGHHHAALKAFID
jgi:hypothetical protein